MVLNEAVQTLREAEELKQKVLKFKNGVSMLQERSIWTTQQQLQKLYQKLLVLDLEYALDKKVEQELWNVGFKQQIEALQAISKDRKNARRSDGQQMLARVLQAASGFYLCLLHQISMAFRLDLPFRRRVSLLGAVEAWGAGCRWADARSPPLPAPAAALYICQHCLVHLGDLARYRQQLRVAHTFYRHALLVSPHSGQPYNQLALVSWRRGQRLGALYWHVRSLLVRAPFPPAPANLARTLAAAAAATATAPHSNTEDLPVLPGVLERSARASGKPCAPAALTAHTFVGQLIRAYHLIHTMDDLETATQLVNTLNSSLTALVATDSFEPMTLVKMACISIWLVGWATEELRESAATLTAAEGAAASLAASLAAGALLSLLLCSRDHRAPALPALKVYLEWVVANPQLLRDSAVLSRPQLWPALAHTLNTLAEHTQHFQGNKYDAVPLPEEDELHGFLPLERALADLKFSKFASWDTYGDRVPQCDPTIPNQSPMPSPTLHLATDDEPSVQEDNTYIREGGALELQEQLEGDAALAGRVRARRLVRLGRALVALQRLQSTQYILLTTEDGVSKFAAAQWSGEPVEEPRRAPPPPPPPLIISEADFREKVREKRVGILKPQGSLERAREERALVAATQDNAQPEPESGVQSERTEEGVRGAGAAAAGGRTRTNVAMQAILRVQEESGKQVKFVTPVTTPDSTVGSFELSPAKESEKTKILQPKAIKSLANLPIGKKTGGILSLKDKSAGYPHLVHAESDPPKKSDDSDKGKKLEAPSVKLSQGPSQNSQTTFHPTPYSAKARTEQHHQHAPATSPSWPAVAAQPPAHYGDAARTSYSHQKNYNQQNPTINPNTLYSQQNQMNAHGQGIRLPVVNPKEIDVRSAALQKQYSRQDMFPDGPKFGNQNWQVSGDKKAFLNDLPPRFANQFRQWSGAPADQQYGPPSSQDSNKFHNDTYKPNNMYANNNLQSNIHPGWSNVPLPSENTAPPPYSWWSTDTSSPSFNPNYATPAAMNTHPTFYPQSMSANISNPYHTHSYSQMSNQQQVLPPKPNENAMNSIGTGYMHGQGGLSQPQAQSLQNLIKSPNYNMAMSSFGNYNQSANYDSSMYPQFTSNKLGYQPPTVKLGDKQHGPYGPQKEPAMDLGHGLGLAGAGGGMSDLHPRTPLTGDLMAGVLTNDNMNLLKSFDQLGMGESGAEGGNTYSLFSAGEEATGPGWGGAVSGGSGAHLSHHQRQSLWSGPGPSPLERLLEQQKRLNKAAGEPQ